MALALHASAAQQAVLTKRPAPHASLFLRSIFALPHTACFSFLPLPTCEAISMAWHSIMIPIKKWKWKNERTAGRRSRPPPPGRLPRRCKLSSSETRLERPYSDQNHSLLFSRLPVELRQAVYEFAPGHRLIHLGYHHDHEILDTPNGPLLNVLRPLLIGYEINHFANKLKPTENF